MTVEQIIHVQKIMNMEPVSLSTPVGDKSDGSDMGDFIECDSSSPEEIAIKNDNEQFVRALLDKLPPRESICVKKYYGFDDGIPKTLEQVGQEYGVTRERIRQILAKATRKLKQLIVRSRISVDDLMV